MKRMNHLWILLASIALVSLGCTSKSSVQSGAKSSSPSENQPGAGGDIIEDEGPAVPLPTTPNALGKKAGIQSFESIYRNMAEVTGVDRSRCQEEFDRFKGSLPISREIASLTSSPQTATIKVASCFCDEAIMQNRNGARANLLPNFDFGKDGNEIADTDIQFAVDGLTKKFWGRGLNTLPNPISVATLLSEQMKHSLANDLTPDDRDATMRAVFGVCVAVLGSIPANML